MKAGWKTVKLGEVCSFERGLTYSKSDEAEAPGITVLRANNVDLTSGRLNLDDLRYISAKVAVDEKKYLSANSIIVCTASGSRDHLGKTAHISEPPRMTFGGFMGLLRPSPEIDSLFLFYLTRSDLYRSFISGLSSGTNINNLKGSDLLSWEIPLPPLAEQKRIVALLDEAFAGIDEAKVKAECATRDYHDLSRGIADRLLFPPDSTRTVKALGEVVEIARGGSPRPIQDYFTEAADGINWIKISDATASGKYIYETAQKIKPSGLKKTRLVKSGDFLLSNSMSFGRPYIMKTTGCIHDGWLVLSGVERQLDQDYLYHVLGSNAVYAQFDRLAAGSTVRNLNSESASKVLIPVPPMSLQKEIAKKLDHAQDVIAGANKLASRKQEALNNLRASLLSQAFSGELA